MKPIIQSFCFLFVVACTTLQGHAQQVTKTFQGIKKIHLSTSSGNCKLVKGNADDVEVNVTFDYSNDDYKPVLEQDGTTLELKEQFNRRGSFSGSSSWVLTVPENMDIRLSSGSGNFEASDMKVTISANTGSGNYHWKNITGDSKINTGSGDISISNFSGDIDLNTGSGDVEITKADGALHANSGSGKINMSDVKGKISANVGSGNITCTALTLTEKSSFNSGSGDVVIKLTSPLTYGISVNSGSGDAVLDLNGVKAEGKLVMTVSKKHGKIVSPFPFDSTTELNNDDGNDVRIQKTAQLGTKDTEIRISSGSGTAEVKK